MGFQRYPRPPRMASLSPVSARPPTVGGRRWVGLIATRRRRARDWSCSRSPNRWPVVDQPRPGRRVRRAGLAPARRTPHGILATSGCPAPGGSGPDLRGAVGGRPRGAQPRRVRRFIVPRSRRRPAVVPRADAPPPLRSRWSRSVIALRACSGTGPGPPSAASRPGVPRPVVDPDPACPHIALSALCVVTGAVTVEAFRRRSAELYLAAAALLGWGMSWKIHAVGLVAPSRSPS